MLVIDEKFTIQILLAPPFHSCTVHSLNDAFNVKCHKSCSLLGKSKLVEKAANVQLRMIKYVNYVIMWICSKWSEKGNKLLLLIFLFLPIILTKINSRFTSL